MDLGEAILAPGFVDAHAHLEWSLMDGVLPSQPFAAWLGRLLGLRGRMEPEDHLVAARHGALRALRAGTTTLADSGPTGAGVIAMAEAGCGPVHLEAFGREEGEEARVLAAGVADRVAALAAAADPRNVVGLSPPPPTRWAPGCGPPSPSCRPSRAAPGPPTWPSPRTRRGSSRAATAR